MLASRPLIRPMANCHWNSLSAEKQKAEKAKPSRPEASLTEASRAEARVEQINSLHARMYNGSGTTCMHVDGVDQADRRASDSGERTASSGRRRRRLWSAAASSGLHLQCTAQARFQVLPHMVAPEWP